MRLKWIGKTKLDFTDFLILVGAGLTFYGIYQIFPPASYITLGIALIYYALQIEKNK